MAFYRRLEASERTTILRKNKLQISFLTPSLSITAMKADIAIYRASLSSFSQKYTTSQLTIF